MNTLTIGTKRYSSWSLRGWLAVHLAGLEVREVVIPLAGGVTAAVKTATDGATVPHLVHDGVTVWESLAICEYCAERHLELWPLDRAARSRARALAAEMHAGFAALRRDMPMSLFRDAIGAGRTQGALADIARIETLWDGARAAFGTGGPFLFGATFGAVDAMFAPVAARFLTYRPEISAATWSYVEAVRAHPLVDRWYAEAASEPKAWMIPNMEAPFPPL